MTPRTRWMVTAAAPLVGLLVAEIGVRCFFADEVDTERLARRTVPMPLAPMVRPSSDPELIYELEPFFDRLHLGVRVVTDADGLRIGAPSTPRPDPPSANSEGSEGAAPLRVAAVGASTTFGVKVPFEDTYPQLFAARLSEWLGREVDLRVFAVPGYNARQQAHLFMEKVLPWAPGLVVWHYDHRDAFPSLGPDTPVPMTPQFGDNPLRSQLVKLILRRRQASRVDAGRFHGEVPELYESYFVAGDDYEVHLNRLRDVGDRAWAAGIPVVFVIFDAFLRRAPAFAEAHLERLHRPLHVRLKAAGFFMLDLAPRYLEEMHARGWLDLHDWWLSTEPLDGHPNAAGHAWLADEVIAYIRARSVLASRLGR